MITVETLARLDGTPHANVFPEAEPKTIRLHLPEGEAVAAHSHPGRDIVFHLLEGRIELTLDEERYELEAGEIARFEGERDIAPRALEESTALIVLAERTTD